MLETCSHEACRKMFASSQSFRFCVLSLHFPWMEESVWNYLVYILTWVVVLDISYFHPKNWERFPIWLIFFTWVGEKPPTSYYPSLKLTACLYLHPKKWSRWTWGKTSWPWTLLRWRNLGSNYVLRLDQDHCMCLWVLWVYLWNILFII